MLNILEDGNKVEAIVGGKPIRGTGGPVECAQWIQELERKGGNTGEVKMDANYNDFKAFATKVKEKNVEARADATTEIIFSYLRKRRS